MLIDTHAHLSEIDPLEIEKVLVDARSAGVERIVAVGMNLQSNRETLGLAKRFPGVVLPAIGYHPWEINESNLESEFAFIGKHLEACVALGEIGLDYKVNVPKKIQWRVFERLLRLAIQFDKPVIVHCRSSHQRSHRMVKAAGIERAVFHWYSGPMDTLREIIEDGYCVSATPALKYSPSHQEALKAAPLENILIETDTPVAYRNQVSSPATLVVTLRLLGKLKQLPLPEVARITTANAQTFFNLPVIY